MATLDEEIGNPNVRKFLDFLSAAEGTTKHGYNTQVGGTRFESLAAHPNNTTVVTADGKSNAAGRYQFLGSTWAEQSKKLGLTDFSAESQDKGAVGLIKDRGAFEDVTSGNFTGAIKKLGGVWASLPSSPYKQAKRSWDWTKSQLGADTPQRDYNDSGWQQGGMTPSEDVMKQMQKDAKPSNVLGDLATGISAGFKNDNTGVNWWNTRVGDAVEDPNFSMTPERIAKFTEGVDQKNWAYIASNATSDAHAAKLQQHAMEFQKTEKLYDEAGFGAGVGRMAVGLLDPTNLGLIALTAVAPEMGAPVAASRWGRIGYGALEGAVSNTAIEALTYQNRPGGDLTDVAFAGLMGVGLGGVGGSFARERALKGGSKGGETIFDHDIGTIKSWSLTQLQDISASDYAKMVMFKEDLKNLTPEQIKFRQAELQSEYHLLLEKRQIEGLHGTGDLRPPTKVDVAGEVPPKAPEPKRTWGAEWDTPSLHKASDGSMVLQLPPKQPIESLVRYIQLHSPDKAMVAWMGKILDGIDLNHIKFFETGASKKPEWYIKGSKLGSKDAAHIVTPWGSRGTLAGDKVEFVQRGKYSKRVGDK